MRVDRSPRRMTAVTVTALLFMGALAACGRIEDQSMCSVYEDFLAARVTVQEIDPTAQTAGAAAEVVRDYLDAVNRLEETVDGRFGTELDTLEAAVDDILVTLDSVEPGEDYSTWAPLVEDSVNDATDAAVSVENADRAAVPAPG